MPTPPLRPSNRLSGACFLGGSLFFTAGWLLAFVAAPDLVVFFYQPRVLAVTHTFTLGWVSLTMIGVLHQYVPALTKHPLPAARFAPTLVAVFALGAIGMIAHFWIGRPSGMAWSAAMVAVAALLLGAQLLPALARAPRYDATVIGLGCAIVNLGVTATLGALFAIDKVYPLLGGSVISNIAAHAHLALLGWVSLTICAVSYRMVAAFALPTRLFPAATRRQIVSLAVLAPAIFAALWWRSRWTSIIAPLVVAAMAWYASILLRMIQTRRMPVEWTMRHALAAIGHLGVAAIFGMTLVYGADPGSESGARLATAYGLLLLGGWVSNFIVGIGVRMAPGLMGLAAPPLLSERGRASIFWLLNGGVAAAAAAVLWQNAAAVRIATLAPLAAGLIFSCALARHWRRVRAHGARRSAGSTPPPS